jgi:RNA polymerase sigma-70 factor (ECF subfamily)
MENTDEKFREIYEKYKNLIVKVAYDMTGDYHLAQDICQETFIKLYGFQTKLDEDRVKSWLVVVAANKVRDHRKKGGKYTEVVELSDEWGLIQDTENTIDQYVDRLALQDFSVKVLKGLRQRREDWYEVFVMVEFLHIPRPEIARMRGISLSTVDAHLNRGKKWMIKTYGREYEMIKGNA